MSNTVPLLKEEQIDFSPDSFHSRESKYNSLIPSSTKLDSIATSVPFSLDDITGDVHHIQSSLDNIREFMFENLPDGTTIEDLFSDDPSLLSPLLSTTNILSDDLDQSKSTNNPVIHSTPPLPVQCKQLMLHKSELPMKTPTLNVDNQLLEQLFNETIQSDQQPSTQVNSRK